MLGDGEQVSVLKGLEARRWRRLQESFQLETKEVLCFGIELLTQRRFRHNRAVRRGRRQALRNIQRAPDL